MIGLLVAAWAGPAGWTGWDQTFREVGGVVVRVESTTQEWATPLVALFQAFGAVPILREDVELRSRSGSGLHLGEGRVLTCQHLVAGAAEIRADARPAWVEYADAGADLAILSTTGLEERPAVAWADGAGVQAEPVATIGLPAGARAAVVSAGLLSPGRELSFTGEGITYLLTDAYVTVGHSGGALLRPDGTVLGVLVGGLTGDGEGLGLAVPAERARLALSRVPVAETGAYGWDTEGSTARVSAVPSPERWGLAVGDVILSASVSLANLGTASGAVLLQVDGRGPVTVFLGPPAPASEARPRPPAPQGDPG